MGAAANATYAATIPHVVFGLIWTFVIYDPLAHWVWADGGWLRTLGALDFAGGTVVHISAGVSALVAAMVLGKRRDYGRATIVPHNVPFTLLGAGLLWFGWFGFNAGSALSANAVAANAFLTTHSSAAAALATWLLADLLRNGRATAVGAATGAVVGLVAITPAAGFVSPVSALAIGSLSALLSYGAILLRPRIKIDDALDVFACHGVAGISGALLTGVFATKAVNPAGADGLLAGNPGLIGIQLVAVGATVALSGLGSWGILRLVDGLMGLRVSLGDEAMGVDLSEHGEAAYHGGGVGDLVGRSSSLGDSVVMPVSEAPPALARRRS